MPLDSHNRYSFDVFTDTTLAPPLEHRHAVREYCHNCGKYGHLNEVNVLGIKFALCDDCYEEFRKKHNCCPVFCNEKHPWWLTTPDINKVTC